MRSRRGKPVPPPILPPSSVSGLEGEGDRVTSSRSPSSETSSPHWGGSTPSAQGSRPGLLGNRSRPTSAVKGGRHGAGDESHRQHLSVSLPKQQPQPHHGQGVAAALSEPPNTYLSPTSAGMTGGATTGVAPFPARVSVLDGKGLGATETVVLKRQATNTRAIVDVVQLDFSEAMRGYRVCRQGPTARPWLRLFGANDMVLMAVAVSFFLSCLVTLNGFGAKGSDPIAAMAQRHHSPTAALSPENREQAELRTRLEQSFFFKLRLGISVLSFILVVIRFCLSLQDIYVEEVIAIRGVGIQLTDYGVFNQIKRRQFIDVKLIRSLVVHDAFFRYQPIFFLSSSVENQPKRVVYFKETLPRLETLRLVLRGLRHVLYGEEETGPSLSDIQLPQSSLPTQQVMSDDDTYTRSDESGLEGSQDFHSSSHRAPSDDERDDMY